MRAAKEMPMRVLSGAAQSWVPKEKLPRVMPKMRKPARVRRMNLRVRFPEWSPLLMVLIMAPGCLRSPSKTEPREASGASGFSSGRGGGVLVSFSFVDSFMVLWVFLARCF